MLGLGFRGVGCRVKGLGVWGLGFRGVGGYRLTSREVVGFGCQRSRFLSAGSSS